MPLHRRSAVRHLPLPEGDETPGRLFQSLALATGAAIHPDLVTMALWLSPRPPAAPPAHTTRPDVRRAILFRSVTRALGDEVVVREAAYVWRRHKWMVPYGATVFGAVTLLAPIGGIEDWPTRIAIGAAAVAVAVTATTDYSVVAQTDAGLALFKASKIRQIATEFREHLPGDVELTRVGGTLLAADWQVGERVYTVPRSSDQAMNRMAAIGPTDTR